MRPSPWHTGHASVNDICTLSNGCAARDLHQTEFADGEMCTSAIATEFPAQSHPDPCGGFSS